MKGINQHPWIIDLTSWMHPLIERKEPFQVANLTFILSVIAWKWMHLGFPWKTGQRKYWKGITPAVNPNKKEILCTREGDMEPVKSWLLSVFTICSEARNKMQKVSSDNAHFSSYLCKKLKYHWHKEYALVREHRTPRTWM